MPTGLDFKRALPWVGPFAELRQALALHASRTLRSIRAVPVPCALSADIMIESAKEERGNLAMTAQFMAPGNSSQTLPFANAVAMVRDAVAGQARMPAEGGESTACRTLPASVRAIGPIVLKDANNLLIAGANELARTLIPARRSVAEIAGGMAGISATRLERQ